MEKKTNEDNAPKWPYELFGVECGDGWKKLLPPLFEKIEEYNKELADEDKIVIEQIKEKFGELRIYLSYYPEEIKKLVNELENQAAKTCELCGSTEDVGLKVSGWCTTLCRKCAKEIAKKSGLVVFRKYENGKVNIYRIYDDGKEELVDPKTLP